MLQLEEGCAISRVQAAFSTLHVGTMTYIRSESELLNVSRIGRFCSIGNSVVIGQEKAGHPLDWVSTHPMQYTGTPLHYVERGEPAEIGHDVWIGREAMIMEGVKVSTGAVIAARSLVTCDVPLCNRGGNAGPHYPVSTLGSGDQRFVGECLVGASR